MKKNLMFNIPVHQREKYNSGTSRKKRTRWANTHNDVITQVSLANDRNTQSMYMPWRESALHSHYRPEWKSFVIEPHCGRASTPLPYIFSLSLSLLRKLVVWFMHAFLCDNAYVYLAGLRVTKERWKKKKKKTDRKREGWIRIRETSSYLSSRASANICHLLSLSPVNRNFMNVLLKDDVGIYELNCGLLLRSFGFTFWQIVQFIGEAFFSKKLSFVLQKKICAGCSEAFDEVL